MKENAPEKYVFVAPIEKTSAELLAQLEHKEWYLPALKMNEHRQCEWLSVRVLLKKITGEEKQILYTETGKPFLADGSYHISISHTKGYVAIALNREKPVAIDIEQISPRVEKLYKRFINETEAENLSATNQLVHLLLHWSAKEALFKLLDENDIEFNSQLHIHPFEPVGNQWASFPAHETRTEKQQSFVIHYLVTKDYVLTVT